VTPAGLLPIRSSNTISSVTNGAADVLDELRAALLLGRDAFLVVALAYVAWKVRNSSDR
jgi:hypothetical protein